MDIKYEIEPVFKIEFFKIKCIDFKNKKKKLEKVLERYPEMPQANFSSNRNKCSINTEFREIFKDEFSLIRAKFNSKIFSNFFFLFLKSMHLILKNSILNIGSISYFISILLTLHPLFLLLYLSFYVKLLLSFHL